MTLLTIKGASKEAIQMVHLQELSHEEMNEVSGGIRSFFLGYLISKGMDGYIDWVQGGAGGWKEDYNGIGYDDPLL
ncbi:hypothetical protein GTH32_00610 [Alteromonas sp. 345S023]|uniref:Bacteriocin n=1 Tax=Alteromonas profundi TaxID=2696062 RepID=A0A7X5LI46_9ALTE|nr:hypothetical protein [Alteromonas profundi]NDV89698.1 hypothetical protein [Alteromonas profundi]